MVEQGDTIAPAETNASKFHRLLPASQLRYCRGVAHYTFLDTCGLLAIQSLPVYCTDAAGVDRDQVHAKVAVWQLSSSIKICAELLCVEDRVVDVGPELFEGEVGGVDDVSW